MAPSETTHLRRTLRLDVGDSCLVTDGEGREAEARISSFAANGQAVLTLERVLPIQEAAAPALQIFIYPAFIQKGKMDELVRQLQELGVCGFFPVETERTIVKMEKPAKIKTEARWRKIAQEAAKQSGGRTMLAVKEPAALKEVLAAIPPSEKITVFHPASDAISFSEWVTSERPKASACHLFFGPEGGWSEKEMALFQNKGAQKVTLGRTVLKADTAVLGVASALRFLFP